MLRQPTEFGDATGFGRISGEYFSLAAGVDTTPLFQGLEGNMCQCPHWGFVLRGRITTTGADGASETVSTDAEIVMFSPQREHSQVINHMIDKVGG